MKDRSDDPSHHEKMLLPQSYILPHQVIRMPSQDQIQMKGSREEPEMSHLQNCGYPRFFQSTVRTSPVFPWDSLSSTPSSGGPSRFFPRNISRMETMGCKQAPHAVNSGTEIL